MFKTYNLLQPKVQYGKILHVDGDIRYSNKAAEYYKKNRTIKCCCKKYI